MTYQNDPNRRLNPDIDSPDAKRRGMGSIILGSLAVLAVIFGLFFMMSDRTATIAMNTDNRPAATTTAPAPLTPNETTGAGNTPGGASTTPAPAFPAPANR